MSLAVPTATPIDDAEAAPLVRRLAGLPGAGWVDADSFGPWLDHPGDRVLFFSGDPVRFPEGGDVAVVLPELQAAFPNRFVVGAVVRRDEDLLARRYGVVRWPSLVFLRGGRYVTTLAGMHDWTDFLSAVGAALEQPVSRPPTVGIPLVSADGGGAGHACH